MEENYNSILKVKVGEVWTDIPALRGYSVSIISIDDINIDGTQGKQIIFFDEKKKALDPSYTGDEIIILNGIDGTGSVNQVDGQGAVGSSHNVPLNAVRYPCFSPYSPQNRLLLHTKVSQKLVKQLVNNTGY